jgi:hypothetical protein
MDIDVAAANSAREMLRRTFPEMSEQEITRLLEGAPQDLCQLRSMTIHYALIWLNEIPHERVSPLARDVVSLLRQHHGGIASILLPIILATFASPADMVPNAGANMFAAAESLIATFPASVKLVYGSVPGKYGMHGCPVAAYFGPLIPLFTERTQRLLSLAFGDMCRMD